MNSALAGAIMGLGALSLAQPTMTHAETLRFKCDYRSNVSPTGLAAEKLSLGFALDTITGKAVTSETTECLMLPWLAAIGHHVSRNARQRRSANHDDNEKRYVSSQPPYDAPWKADTLAVLRDVRVKPMYCARLSRFSCWLFDIGNCHHHTCQRKHIRKTQFTGCTRTL